MKDSDGVLKLAYRAGAAIAANEAGMTKDAGLWGKLLSGVGKLFPTKTLNAPARHLARTVGKRVSPAAGHYTGYLGKGLVPSMAGGGLFDSAISAATAPEGQRWEAARDAFLPGALAWGGWHLGARGANLGLQRGARSLLGREGARNLRTRQKMPWFSTKKHTADAAKARFEAAGMKRTSPLKRKHPLKMKTVEPSSVMEQLTTPGQRLEGMKNIGAKAYGSALPFGAAMYTSGAVSDALHPEPPTVPYPAMYDIGRGAMREYARYPRGFGLQPTDYGYM